ncbi:putative enzyme related to lactoylglutathione lyase [Rhodococcus sp. 27YEA15]|uniref:VOC family protein n=1 Tax=Rhodococcus sp. 27YEA15 TaxID=3156259 RepID=UPI003C7D4053
MEILSSRTILRPSDYELTLSFYRDTLGLAISREYPGGTVFFAGQSLIEIATHGYSDRQGFSGSLWLQVRDLTAAQTELVLAGVKIVREARQEPWGLHEMWIADPDGTPIVMVQVPADHPIRRDSRPPSE